MNESNPLTEAACRLLALGWTAKEIEQAIGQSFCWPKTVGNTGVRERRFQESWKALTELLTRNSEIRIIGARTQPQTITVADEIVTTALHKLLTLLCSDFELVARPWNVLVAPLLALPLAGWEIELIESCHLVENHQVYFLDLMLAVADGRVELSGDDAQNNVVMTRWFATRILPSHVCPPLDPSWVDRIRKVIQGTHGYDKIVRPYLVGGPDVQEMERRKNTWLAENRLTHQTRFIEIGLAAALQPYSARLIESERRVTELELERDGINPALYTRVDELELSVRAANCLTNARIEFVYQIVTRGKAGLLKIRGFGTKSMDEVEILLGELGITVDSSLPEKFKPPNSAATT